MISKRIDTSALDLKDKIVAINRVTKVVKGGRTMSFAALVVVGDGNGHVGVGLGKASETSEAIRKGKEDAKKNVIKVEINEQGTIAHEMLGVFGASSVLMKPSKEGTGVIAGGPVRAVMELAGVRNISTKSIGSNNKRNVLNATMEGLARLKSPETVARLRGKSVEEILS